MASFEGAVEVGSDAIETDIHLTKDDVVVLSHVGVPDSSAVLTGSHTFRTQLSSVALA